MTPTIEIVEVGPRDGLQNEKEIVSPETRAELVNRLTAAGVRRTEAVSFVHPGRVPQMAGAEEVMAQVTRRPGVRLAGLVLNEKGFERALAAGVDEVRYAFPVTESFAARNQNTTVAEALALGLRLIGRAREAGVGVGVVLAASFGCPFEGRVPVARVLEVAGPLLEAAPDELIYADTIGVGVPNRVRELLGAASAPGVKLGAHFHNTRHTGYANAVAAVEAGATVLDASLGGIGGCPFAPRATGNIATEDLVYLLEEMGIETGLNLDGLIDAAKWLEGVLGRPLPGGVYKAGGFPQSVPAGA